jgi:hypothetical protein
MSTVDAPTTVAEARWLLGLPAWCGCTHGDPWICDCEHSAALEWWEEHPELEEVWGDGAEAFDQWYVDGWPELVR